MIPAKHDGRDADAPLPERQGVDRVVLAARDPAFGHAYWEVAPERVQHELNGLGGRAHGVLRLIDAEFGHVIDRGSVFADLGKFVVRFPEGDRRYAVEIALETEDGRSTVLVRSEDVLAPPAFPRPPGDVAFVSLDAQIAVLDRALDVQNPPKLVVSLPDVSRRRVLRPLPYHGWLLGGRDGEVASSAWAGDLGAAMSEARLAAALER